jgi:hypothetical protein
MDRPSAAATTGPSDPPEPPSPPEPPLSVARFFRRGALPVMPRRQADRERVLAYVASRTLPVDDPVTEPELTARLARVTRDPVGLRRALVDAGLVTRTRDGAEYWRTRVTEFDPL